MKKIGKVLVAGGIVILSCQCGHAQLTPSSVDSATREVDRSMREEETEKMRRIPEKKPVIEDEREEEDTGPKYFIRKITLKGCKSLDSEVFRSIIEEYEQKEVGIIGLNNLARKIQKEYLKRGIVSTCFVPEQKISDGDVTLKVIEAKMGVLNIQGNEYYNDNTLAAYWMMPEGKVLRYNKMLRSLDLMNENPDRTVKVKMQAGKNPNTTDITLVSDTHFPLHATASFDREGAPSTGRNRIGIGGRDNNFLLVDDILMAGVLFGEDFQSVYAYHSVPLGYRGTILTYGYSQSKASPKKEFAVFNINSRSDNWSAFVYQDVYSKNDVFIEAYVGMDVNDKVTRTIDGVFNKDKLRIVRLGTNVIANTLGGWVYIQPQFSQGINIFGASGKNDLSSRGASSNFAKFNLDVRYVKPMPLDTKLSVRFRGQVCGEKLTPQEEMFLGGINSVRGYPMGDYLADNAVVANIEMLYPGFFIPGNFKLPFDSKVLKDRLTGTFFVDFAYGSKRGYLPSERKDAMMMGIGPGLRVQLYDQVHLRLAWGIPVGRKPQTEVASTRLESSRVHFAIEFEGDMLGYLVGKMKK